MSKITTGNKQKNIIPNKYRLFLMLLPFIVVTFIFSYFPLYGWKYAFYNYTPGLPLTKEDFVGLYWFKSIVQNPILVSEVLRVMKNTFAMSLIGIATSALPVVFAIFLSELRVERYKKFVQIFTTLPNFISWVLVYSFAFTLFSVDTGLINQLLIKLNIIDSGINFLASTSHVWLSMCLWSIWKGLGWGGIIYLAAIAGIDQELYEAAKVDGAGRFRMMWHITVPGVLPTFFVLLLLSIAGFLNNGMEQYYVFQNPMNKDAIEVLDLYVFNIGLGSSANFSFATAVSALKSLISVVLLFIANSLSKIFRGETII